MNNRQKIQEDLFCERCRPKYNNLENSFVETNDFTEEKYCFNCLNHNIENEAKCLYKGLPSCYPCAVSSNQNLKRSLNNSKSIANFSAFNKRNTFQFDEFDNYTPELVLTEKVSSHELDYRSTPNNQNNNHRISSKELKLDFTTNSNNLSSNNLSTSISSPKKKSIFDIVSNNMYSSRRSIIPKSPMNRLNSAVETVFKPNLNNQKFNYKDIIYPVIWEHEKGKRIDNRTIPEIRKGNYMMLFLDNSYNLVFGIITSFQNSFRGESKMFKMNERSKGIIYLDPVFETILINENQIVFNDKTYFDLKKYQLTSNISSVYSIIDQNKTVNYTKIYELF